MHAIILKPGRDKSLLRRHPWVFSGAVAKLKGEPASGETIRVLNAAGQQLGLAAYSPQSQIVARIWNFGTGFEIDADFFRQRLQRAIERRREILDSGSTNSARLVFSESDGLPGLIVDRYGEVLVCQFLSAGAEVWNSVIVECLRGLVGDLAVYERSDTASRKKEGLSESQGFLTGELPPEVVLQEHGVQFELDIKHGHKTGFYLDQRDNREMVARHSAGAEVLDCFAYQGGFGLNALHGGAGKVTFLEASAEAQEIIGRNVARNGFDASRVEQITGDVFKQLRLFRDQGRKFDVIVLDPPKFAESHQQVNKAARGYKDINLLAFSLLRPGGKLFTFSCSGHIKPDLFQKIIADAALDAKREAWIVRRLDQAADHPVSLNFPEAQYLKGLLCGVD